MDTTLSVDTTLTDIAWFLVVGIAVAGFLIAMFWLGKKVRAREPAPPSAESQPHLPEGGAVLEVREEREHVEIPKSGPKTGLRPHEMQGYGNFGSTTAHDQEKARREREENEPDSGAFGSGGHGA
ncbi:DUF6479 family protein [Streptomyces antimicrobicus]|uniref:DUF6479 family protein n=1 Tax=Streptomyces antimicrobicus TaxID=2883108 RepID=A0ABS8AZJ8_9ACTN|nr:DUF6479 family protein [Streptomyces antimicrobicus]MCB5177782.1 DUF6479 family protein [Streptomyces antimicrobicus]